MGWHWLCPQCKKLVRTIYFPVPVRTLFDSWFTDPVIQLKLCDADLQEPPPPTFACMRCHRITYFSSTKHDAWNQVITYLSAGMLYGHEVPKPQWYRKERKRARSRQIFRAAPKREAILRRLSNGWTLQHIASDMLISLPSVYVSVSQILRQEQVKNRRELAAKLFWNHEQPLNNFEKRIERARQREARVLPLLLGGSSLTEIAATTAMSLKFVRKLASRIYKQHGLKKGEGRPALGKNLGIELNRFGRPRAALHP